MAIHFLFFERYFFFENLYFYSTLTQFLFVKNSFLLKTFSSPIPCQWNFHFMTKALCSKNFVSPTLQQFTFHFLKRKKYFFIFYTSVLQHSHKRYIVRGVGHQSTASIIISMDSSSGQTQTDRQPQSVTKIIETSLNIIALEN